jgi:DNA-binding CsgD family transcriptional regulator
VGRLGRSPPLEDTLDVSIRHPGSRPFLGELVGASSAAPPKRASAEPYGLTRREREVLGLLAEACSDQAIGDRLGISRRTASSHVAAIFDKLGVANRTAAATLAVRLGLA